MVEKVKDISSAFELWTSRKKERQETTFKGFAVGYRMAKLNSALTNYCDVFLQTIALNLTEVF